ncbi:MAG: hypothetical protein ACQERZ_07575 [Fusobacteriota bacterium]
MGLLEINKMQIELIKESGLIAQDWIRSYSAHFRKLIQRRGRNIEIIKKELYKN